jgi:subtilisin family serine protease
MSGDDSSNDSGIELSRRTFAKATGAAVGAGLFGASADTVSADHPMDRKFANPRVQELAKVWDRGYRGSNDNALGLTDSGIDARHPDLGPWNGVEIVEDDGGFALKDRNVDFVRDSEKTHADEETVSPASTTGTTTVELVTLTPDAKRSHASATMTWTPSPRPSGNEANSLDLLFQREVEGGWETVAETGTSREVEELTDVPLEADTPHRFAATGNLSTVSELTITARTYDRMPAGLLGSEIDPFSVGPDEAKTIGWFNAGSRYGNSPKPRDPDGHGSHCASIMGGSGRASEVTREVETSGETRQLQFGNTVDVDVFVDDGEAGVYASAYGDSIEIDISERGPRGETVASSTISSDASTNDNNTVSVPADPDEAYTVTIRPASTEESDAIAQGLNGVGRVDSYSVGTFADPPGTTGDRGSDTQVALHSGVAPDAPLVGLQGLSGPIPFLGEYATEFSETFNLRAVNMSWGYVGGLPLGAAGGASGDVFGDVVGGIRDMAEQGILTVAAAGNAATPANGNGAPAVADETISVVATGPKDGISGYSSGGIGAVDDGEDGTYMKPDVTAPGGTLDDLVTAAEADTDYSEFDTDTGPQDYTGKAGTSMAAPFTSGVAGLVADAMEDEDPEGNNKSILNSTAQSGINDTFRLKQVILATATETVFTAAPYHRAKSPSYQGSGRDPFEGYGRVNPDAAVDAVTRNVYDGGDSLTNDEFSPDDADEPVTSSYGVTDSDGNELTVGLDVPQDNRAVAGYVEAPRGVLDLTVSAGNLRGADVSMATGAPQVDVFVYDGENPGPNGVPNVVAQGTIDATSGVGARRGSLTLTVDTGEEFDLGRRDEVDTRTLFVVAKLVNIPGLVNGFDARTDIEFRASFTPEFEPLPGIDVSGERFDSGDRFTANARNTVRVDLNSADVTEGRIYDRVPADWTVTDDPDDPDTDYEGEVRTEGSHEIIDLGPFGEDDATDGTSRIYAVEAPDSNGSYTFGPARIEVTDDDPAQRGVQAPTADGEGSFTDDNDSDGQDDGDVEITFGGNDPRNVVVGGTSVGSGSDTTLSGSTGDTTDSAADTADDTASGDDDDSLTDTVDDTL